jgi:type I restriction enzyme S subunit
MSAATKHNDTKKNLPHGWRWVKLEDVGKLETGGTPSKSVDSYWSGKYPFVSGADITNFVIGKSNARAFLTKEGLYSGKTVICLDETVLLVTRTRVGRAGIVKDELGISQDITAIRCYPNTAPDYLCYYFHNISKYLIENCRGATIQGLQSEFVRRLPVPLPALSEQKRIASILKDQMAFVDKARAAAEVRLEAVKALPSALLKGVFPRSEDPLPKGWRYGKLKEVASLQGGYAFKSAWFKSAGIRLLRNANIYQDYISWSNVVYLSEQRKDEFRDFALKEGDIVLSLDRPVVAAGLKVSRINKNDIPSLLLQRVVRFKVKQGVSSDFLYSFLHTEAFKVAITKHDQSLVSRAISPLLYHWDCV